MYTMYIYIYVYNSIYIYICIYIYGIWISHLSFLSPHGHLSVIAQCPSGEGDLHRGSGHRGQAQQLRSRGRAQAAAWRIHPPGKPQIIHGAGIFMDDH